MIEAPAHRATAAEEAIRLSSEREFAALSRARESERRAAILGDIAAASRDLQDAGDFEAGLVDWLQRVARIAGADAAGLGEYRVATATARVVPTIRATWASRPGNENAVPVHEDDEVPDTLDFDRWTEHILRGEPVWANYSDLEDPASRRYWDAEGCAGNVLVPVPLSGDTKGFLSFDFYAERPYDSELMVAIRTAADGLGAAMRRQALHRAQIEEREAVARQLRLANAALQSTVDAVASLRTIDAFMPRVLEIVAQAFDAIGAGYFENTDELIWHRFWLEGGRLLAAADLPNLDPQHLPTMELIARGFWVVPEHLGVDVRERAGPCIIHHRSATASPPLHAFCVSRGWDWELNVPLFVNGRTNAAITFFRDEARPFTEADISLAESLAKQISLARQMNELGELERETAVLRERERATRERAALLERSNTAMQQTVELFGEIDTLAAAVPGVLRIVAAAFGADQCAYCEYTEGRIFVRHWYWKGQVVGADELPVWEPAQRAFLRRLSLGFTAEVSPLAGAALERNRPYVVDHREAIGDAQTQRFRRSLGWDLELVIPMVVDGRAVGGLMIYRLAPGPFSDDELELGAALGRQLTLALQVTKRAEREREILVAQEREAQAKRMTHFLSKMVAKISSGVDLPGALGSVVTELARTIGASHVFLLRHDATTRQLRLHLTYLDGALRWGPSGDELALYAAPFPDDVTPAWRVMCELRGLFIPGASPMPAAELAWPGVSDYLEREKLDDVAHIVLFAGDTPIGSLAFEFRGGRRLEPNDKPFIEAATQIAAVAIRMLDLAEEARLAAVALERERLAEARAHELARSNEALQGTIDVLSKVQSLEEFVPSVLELISSAFDAIGCAYYEHLDDGWVYLRYWLWRGELSGPGELLAIPPDHERGTLRALAEGFELPPEQRYRPEIRKRRMVLSRDVRTSHELSPIDRFCIEHGAPLKLAVPLVANDSYAGGLYIRRGDDRPFSDAEIELADHLGKQISLAIRSHRIAARAQRDAVARMQEQVVTEERERMSRDIHDTLAQGYAAILIQVQAIRLQSASLSAEALKGSLDVFERVAKQNLAQARKTMTELRADAFHRTPLATILQECADAQRSPEQLAVELQGSAASLNVPRFVEIEIRHIIQEALCNVRRHARTDRAVIRTSMADGVCTISVIDSGIGFDARTPMASFGLRGMRERASRAGAELSVDSSPGAGTEVRLTLHRQGSADVATI